MSGDFPSVGDSHQEQPTIPKAHAADSGWDPAPGSPQQGAGEPAKSEISPGERSAAGQGSEAAGAGSEPGVGETAQVVGGGANLDARLEALQAENESLKGQYMRIAADFDNFRKRQSRDQDDLRLKITCSTLSEILPVVDNFDRARQQLNPQSEEAQGLHRSYQNLYKQLVDVFKQLGVSPMRVEGEPFDPTLHEAVLREPSQEHPEDVVIEELQRGYHLNGRVLRHALVKVSMGPGPGGAPLNGADLGPAEQAG
jgi:molecular chaperone GrpE